MTISSFSLKNLRIAVFMGGPGAEAEVSRWSGEAVAKALREGGADVIVCDIQGTKVEIPENIDIVFDIIHGTFGEDGTLQAILEERGVSYTGAGVEGSRLAFDKILSKKCFLEAGIPTASFEILQRGERPKMSVPYVIKAPCEGSTIGIHIIKENDEAVITAALEDSFKYGDTVLVEEFFPGRELTVGILGDDILPIIEIKAQEGVYDYQNKYTPGKSEHLIPASLDPSQTKKIQETALAAHHALGLEVYSRVDLILGADGKFIVLEANTLPGMTQTSLLPDAAAVFGLDFTALCARIVELSLQRLKAKG
ncbi:MAG: D-alanine--D-alanine ligase [Verrucomicrobiae bacterium]|nr:D-alanine--D-alanine ligase [Verrucomicrobiae bacterium]